jgi:hypothetical protein
VNKVAIVIPVYKYPLSINETISFNRCIEILNHYPIYQILPQSLTTKIPLVIKRFNDNYFKSKESYNKLLLSLEFYEAFLDYEYILIHQLDCFVFRDELRQWCFADWDFLGAPLEVPFHPLQLTRLNKFIPNRFYKGHGINGGFSLRKVKSFIKVLNEFQDKAKNWKANEDLFFSYYGNLKIPNENILRMFSLETNPEKHFKLSGVIPFGCHHWDWNANFWQTIIQQYGFEL